MEHHNMGTNGARQFRESLESLIGVSEQLSTSLMTRDASQINAAVREHDEVVDAMKGSLDQAAARLDDTSDHRREAKRLCDKLRRVQQSNKRLASSFLTAMNRALIQIRIPSGNQVGTYGATGAVTVPSSPMFISQQG